jgi:hypothetical protein
MGGMGQSSLISFDGQGARQFFGYLGCVAQAAWLGSRGIAANAGVTWFVTVISTEKLVIQSAFLDHQANVFLNLFRLLARFETPPRRDAS